MSICKSKLNLWVLIFISLLSHGTLLSIVYIAFSSPLFMSLLLFQTMCMACPNFHVIASALFSASLPCMLKESAARKLFTQYRNKIISPTVRCVKSQCLCWLQHVVITLLKTVLVSAQDMNQFTHIVVVSKRPWTLFNMVSELRFLNNHFSSRDLCMCLV